MFHQKVSRYGSATHLALAAALPAALTQFISSHWLSVSMLWVSLLAWAWMLFEPSVLSGETVSRARSRVLKGMVRDPFAWFLALAVSFAMIRWMNSGITLFYDAERTVWLVKEPAVTVLPSSSGDSAFLPFAVMVVIATVVIGIRHVLGRNARIWFGVATGAFSALGGLASVICVTFEVEPFRTAAVAGFGEAFFPGSAFAMILPVSVACGIEAEERGISGLRLPFALAVAGNAVAAFVFLPILLSSAYLAVSAVVAAVSLVLCKKRDGSASCARAASMLAFGMLGAVSAVMVPSYKPILQEKVSGFDVGKAFPSALKDRDDALRRVAVAMWKDFQWGGVGVGAFKLQAPFYVDKEEWEVLPPRPERSFNGYFTVIAERGIIGSLFFAVGVGFLVFFWVSRLTMSMKWHRAQDEGRAWVFCVPAVSWAGIAVLPACLADAWFSCGVPLTTLSVGCAYATSLAAASFPKLKAKRAKESKD